MFAALETKDGLAAELLVADDFESVDPHGGSTTGRAEFVENFALLTAEASLKATRHALRIVARVGDVVEVELESEGTIQPFDGSPLQHVHGRSHDWLRREHDGQWRLSRSVSEFVGPPDDVTTRDV